MYLSNPSSLRSSSLRPATHPEEQLAEPHGEATIEALELEYIARLLGHPPTLADARLLPGIDLSKLLSARSSRCGSRNVRE